MPSEESELSFETVAWFSILVLLKKNKSATAIWLGDSSGGEVKHKYCSDELEDTTCRGARVCIKS